MYIPIYYLPTYLPNVMVIKCKDVQHLKLIIYVCNTGTYIDNAFVKIDFQLVLNYKIKNQHTTLGIV